MKRFSSQQLWGGGLIVVGTVALAVVFFSALGIIGDPGGRYDDWVPEQEAAGPEAGFDWEAQGLTVQFADTSEEGDNAIERWVWDFGGEGQSSEPNPDFRFAEEGEWEVTLEVVDAAGLTSKAEGTVEVAPGASDSGEGSIGLSDMADKVVDTVERAAKGSLVVLLVIGMFVVLTLVGGRLLRQGVQILRPVPDRVSVKLRPKELALAVQTQEDRGEEADREVEVLAGSGV